MASLNLLFSLSVSRERVCFAVVVQSPHILRPASYMFVIGMLRRKPDPSVQNLALLHFSTYFICPIISACYRMSMMAFLLLRFTWRIRRKLRLLAN
jgi:hypothetical protein